ncbi:MAG: A24 family peptidase [Anaerolineae bacterium]|nr:A24 family peptidase [Anaerolineae bacterium]
MLITSILVMIIGLVTGGIVNALADDLPHYRRPGLPRYPDGTPRPIGAWLGITAFLLNLRASPSGVKLSWRYPLTEIATICAMLLTTITKSGTPDVSSTQLVFWLVYMGIFVLITVIDIEHKLILFSVIIPSSILAVLDAIITPVQHEPNLQRALLGGAVGFGTFFLLYVGGILYVYVANQLQGRNITEVAFGYGDVMMATLSGLMLGLEAIIFAMFITIFLGALGALIYLVGQRLAGKRYNMFTALPYGPYIVLGTAIMLLFSSQVRILLVGY